MKIQAITVCILSSLLAIGCSDELFNLRTSGQAVLTLRFDLLDYLELSQSSIPYGLAPNIPGNPGSYTLQIPAQTLDLNEELEGISSIDSLEMEITLDFHNVSGQAELTYMAYLSAVGEDPLQTPPIVVETVLCSGTGDVSRETRVAGDERLLALFNEGLMQYQTQVLFEVPDGSGAVAGTAEVVRFDVRIVTTP